MQLMTRRQFLRGIAGVGATMVVIACAPAAPGAATADSEQAPAGGGIL